VPRASATGAFALLAGGDIPGRMIYNVAHHFQRGSNPKPERSAGLAFLLY
jgi:hypothetical protein